MAQRDITPKDRLVFIGDGATPTEVFLQVVCLTSESFNRTTSALDASTACGQKSQPGTKELTVDIAGTQVLSPDSPTMSIEELDDLWKLDTVFNAKIGPAEPQPGDVTRSFKAYITNLVDTTSFDNNFPSFTATLKVLVDTYDKEVEPEA